MYVIQLEILKNVRTEVPALCFYELLDFDIGVNLKVYSRWSQGICHSYVELTFGSDPKTDT